MGNYTDVLPRRLHRSASGVDLTLSGVLDAVSSKTTGLNVGSTAKTQGTLDGLIRIDGGGSGTIAGYGGSYVPLGVDGLSVQLLTSGTQRLLLNGDTFYPNTDKGVAIGTAANRLSDVRSEAGVFSVSAVMGGAHNTSGVAQRGYIVGRQASDTAATRTGYLQIYGQNGTSYGYIGNDQARIGLVLENGGYLQASMTANTSNPMFRLTRQDTSINHLELVAGNTNGAKQHIGSQAGNLYLTTGSYFNGSTWVQDDSGTAASAIVAFAANGSGYLSFRATNTNNTPVVPEVATIVPDGLRMVGNGSIGMYIGGAQKFSQRVIYSGQINHGGNSGALIGGHYGLMLVRIQQTSVSPFYNIALLLSSRDGFNGATTKVVNQTVTGTAHQLYVGGDVGLRWIDGGGGSAPSIHNASGQNLQVTVVELATLY